MTVWVSFFLSALMVGGLLFGLYLAISLVFEGRKAKAKPRMGICAGEKEGELGFWVTWDPTVFVIEMFRLRVSYFNPEGRIKEGMFTVTLDPAQKEGFQIHVALPEEFKDLLTAGQVGRKALVTVDFRTSDGFMVAKDYLLSKIKAVYLKQKEQAVPKVTKLPSTVPDAPAVSSLDFGELVERKKKLKVLADEAKAKAAKAKPAAAPAAAPAAPAPAAG